MAEILDNRIVVLVARKGGGKSYQLRLLLKKERNSVVIYDVRREYGPKSRDAGVFCVDKECLTIEEMEEALHDACEQDKPINLSFVPDEPKKDINEFCRVLFRHYYGLTIAFEEAPAYTEPGFMPKSMELLVLQARHKRHDLYFVGQRYAEMSRSATGQADFHIIGSTKEPNDIEALEKRIGVEATAQVIALKKRDFVTFDVEEQKTSRGVVLPPVGKISNKERKENQNDSDEEDDPGGEEGEAQGNERGRKD